VENKGAIQEGSTDAVACLPVPRAQVFIPLFFVYSFCLVASTTFSCKKLISEKKARGTIKGRNIIIIMTSTSSRSDILSILFLDARKKYKSQRSNAVENISSAYMQITQENDRGKAQRGR
jgi:hypothetical protein